MKLSYAPLENQFVRLAPLTEEHREPLRPLADDPEIWALSTVRGGGAHFDTWFGDRLNEQSAGDAMSYAVWVKAAEAFCGHTSYLAICAEQARLEIGWTWYAAPYRGGAVNPSCKRLLLGHAFAAGAERVELKTHGRNERSQRAMKKMGAQYEGTLRRYVETWTGERRDNAYFSVLREEWPSVMAGLDQRIADFSEAN